MELHIFIANKIIDRSIFGHNIAFLKIIASDENQRLIVILNWIKSRENEKYANASSKLARVSLIILFK